MKRRILLLLVWALLLAGCGGAQTPVETAQETAPTAVTVSNVDELLAALAPDAQIRMEPGSYNLAWASDFGRETESPYYRWARVEDGYELRLVGLQNVTIQGSGKDKTTILAGPRYANVLTLQNCTGVILEDFTAGHTEYSECSGGVVSLLGSLDISLNRLGLFGCGTVGVWSELSTDIAVRECEIYECSSEGIMADRTDGLLVENCVLRDLGNGPYGGGSAIWLGSSGDVRIIGCQIRDNRLSTLISCDPQLGVEVRDTAFERNQVDTAAFYLSSGGMILDGCTFEENAIWSWFCGQGDTVLDGIGKTWDAVTLDLYYNDIPEPTSGAQTAVTVSNVDELLAAIGPDREIVLADGVYDLSTARDYGTGYGAYYYWQEEYDGPVLVVEGVDNMTIRSESGDVTLCTISAVPRYANVFNFRRCSNLTLSGFTAGHTVEPGSCMGGVLDFERCSAVQVENCGLFGCGILGIQARISKDFAVIGCDIYECSYGGIQMGDVLGVRIEDCSFRDLGGSSMSFWECQDITVDGQSVPGSSTIE